MTNTDKANEIIRKRHFDGLSDMLDDRIEDHGHKCHKTQRWGGI